MGVAAVEELEVDIGIEEEELPREPPLVGKRRSEWQAELLIGPQLQEADPHWLSSSLSCFEEGGPGPRGM